MQGPAGKLFKYYFGISFLILSLVLAYAPADVDDLKVGSVDCAESYSSVKSDYNFYSNDSSKIREKVTKDQLTNNGVYIPYTHRYYSEDTVSNRNRAEYNLDHIVARRNAHDSGLCKKSSGARKRFANDLLNITLAPSNLNSAKGHDTADRWMPPRNMCWFAYTIVQVKDKYDLVVTSAEKAKLKSIWNGCNGDFRLEKDR